MDTERRNIINLMTGAIAFSAFFIIVCACILVFLPSGNSAESTKVEVTIETTSEEPKEINYEMLVAEDYPQLEVDVSNKGDTGLAMYRQPQSRPAVEWYYSRVTNNREVTQAILSAADEFSIPLSLAFALAHTESRYKVTAMHKNANGSIDRGLFQLNSNSFTKLDEADFYDPKISAHYGLSHLRYCLNTAGNEVAALAMYNAGANKVRKNNTPQITLNYISSIQNYRNALDENFATEVMAFYGTDSLNKFLAKK